MNHLHLEDNGIVLSNCYGKWCLTGLEKDLATCSEKHVTHHCWMVSSQGSVAETTLLLVKHAGINKNCISLKKVNEQLVIKYAKVEIVLFS